MFLNGDNYKEGYGTKCGPDDTEKTGKDGKSLTQRPLDSWVSTSNEERIH